MKYYHNYQELEKDLSVAKLKTEIEQEKLKLRWAETKMELSPRKLVSDMVPQAAKGFLTKKLIDKLTGGLKQRMTRKKRRRKR